MARTSRACAYTYTSVWRGSASELRSAMVCLINRFRTRRGLPALKQKGQLTAAAQAHTNSMVYGDYFSHGDPATRILRYGFNWGAYGEAISTGYRTPSQAFWAWLGSTEHCQILLSPNYDYIGVGVNPRGVRSVTTYSGTWTADLGMPLGWNPPSGNRGPANRCPY